MLVATQKLFDSLQGKDVYIIGGGPSVSAIDMSSLDNKKIIAINNSYKLLEKLTALYWCDANWADKHHRLLDPHPCKLRFSNRLNHAVCDKPLAHGEILLRKTGDFGYDPNPDHVRGNNGGVQCLNLIINMRPKRIFLLGYDMKLINRQTHWHDGHGGNPVTASIYNNLFIPSMESLAIEIKNYSEIPEIINLSMDSAITCFPKDKIENYMN